MHKASNSCETAMAYPFQRFIDQYNHLDTDELRYLIPTITHVIDQDFKGEEHLYCDDSQRNADGSFRIPKEIMEARSRGFATVKEMWDADKKAEDDTKHIAEQALSKEITAQATQLTALQQQLSQLANQFQAYITAVHGTNGSN